MLRIHDSALKRRWSREDISHAYDMALYDGVLEEDADPPKLLIIGPDSAGNPIELIGAELKNGDIVVWHAMACRPKYLHLLREPGGGQ